MATFSHEQQLANPRYRDWVKAGLATKYLKEGIVEFVDDACRKQHGDMLKDIKNQYGTVSNACNSCCLRTLMPIHSKDRNGCPLGQKPFCNCQNVHRKTLCPTEVCSAMYDKIIIQHMFSAPNWNNTDITQWGRNHWAIAKCYIPGGGYRSKTSARETDCVGLLNIVINNMYVHGMLDCVIDPPNDVFSKTREARDNIFHSSDMELDYTTMESYLNDMIAILNDTKYLCNRQEAIDAKLKLQQLLHAEFRITATDELNVRKEALDAIEEKKCLAISAIENAGERQRNKVVDEIQEKKEQALQLLQTEQKKSTGITMGKLEKVEKNYQQMDINFSLIKQDFARLQCNVETEDRAKTDEMSGTRYKERKKSLQKDLISLYQKYVTKTYILPMMQEDECDVKDVYVDPYMFTGEGQKKKTVAEEANSQPLYRFEIEAKTSEPIPDYENDVKTYKDIFYQDERKNRKIYLSGAAGMGKTTFCKNLISRWCDTHTTNRNTSTREEDIKILREFHLLFFVTLRHIKHERHVNDMINTQLLADEQDKEIFKQVLERESEVCLIILDGLDEWNPTDEEKSDISSQSPFLNINIPQTNIKKKYTVLTTTRPWKLEAVRLKSCEADIHMKLQGFSSSSADMFIRRVVEELNKKFSRTKLHYQFLAELGRHGITDLKSVPVILLQLICIWHDGKPLGASVCDIYSAMINLLFEISKKTVSSIQQCELQLPKCFDNKLKCQENKELLLKLSKLSFETLFPQDGNATMEFDRQKENVCGMSSKEIEICLNLGLLTVSKVVGKSASSRLARLSFLHETFQEFLAAVYVSCASSIRKGDVCEVIIAGENGDCSAIVKRIFSSCHTLLGVLEMGRIFKFVSGLKPDLAKQLSMSICTVVDKISTVQQYRIGAEDVKYPSELKQIQSLIFSCLLEMENAFPESKLETGLYLGDLIVDANSPNGTFFDFVINEQGEHVDDVERKIYPTSTMSNKISYLSLIGIKSVFIRQNFYDCVAEEALEIISSCCTLQKLVIWMRSLRNSFQRNSITNAVFQIIAKSSSSLNSISFGCKHSQQHIGEIVNVPTQLSNLNYICFEGIASHHNSCEKIITLLLNSRNLKTIHLRNMTCLNHRHCSLVMEFPAHHQLQKLNLQRAWNIGIGESSLKVNTDLKNLELIELSEEQMTENRLLSFLNEISKLEQRLTVSLTNVEVTDDSALFKGVNIGKLHVIKQPHKSDNSVKTNVFIDIVHYCSTGKEIQRLYGQVIDSSNFSPTVKCLSIQCGQENPAPMFDITTAIVTEVPKLINLERLTLRNIDFDNAYLKLSVKMENLAYVEVDSCKMTGRAMKSFLGSVPMLRQSLRIQMNKIKVTEKTADDTIPITADAWKFANLKVTAQWFDNGEYIEAESIPQP